MSYFNVPSQQTVEHKALNAPPLFDNGHGTPVLEQHDVELDPLSQFYIMEQPFVRFLRGCTLTGPPTPCIEHETDWHHDDFSLHADSWFGLPAQDLIHFLAHDAFTEEQPSFAGENGRPYSASWLIPATDLYAFLERYALPASESPSVNQIPVEQNGTPDHTTLLLIPSGSLRQFLKRHEVPVSLSSDNGNETPAEYQLDEGSEDDAMSESVTPSESLDSDQVNARPNRASPSISSGCPVCQITFTRVQERNRHLESYLPHSILCPYQICTWTGRRQWDFKVHWERKHPDAGQAPGEDVNEIYDPKDFVESIVGGTPVEKVARSAFAKVQESLERLGKPDVGANVLGRNRDLKKWIRIPSSGIHISGKDIDENRFPSVE